MDRALIKHLHDLPTPPVLDVLGEWVSIPNPRTATTSIHVGPLNDRCITRNRGPRNWERVWWKIIVPRLDELTMFTFVRNPWERALSSFLHCQRHPVNRNHKIDSKLTFSEWVKQQIPTSGIANVHFEPQFDTFRFDGKAIPDLYVGRFEDLHEDWAGLADLLGVRNVLPKLNASEHLHYTEYYDDESQEIIGKLYEPEITLLGYEYGKNR